MSSGRREIGVPRVQRGIVHELGPDEAGQHVQDRDPAETADGPGRDAASPDEPQTRQRDDRDDEPDADLRPEARDRAGSGTGPLHDERGHLAERLEGERIARRGHARPAEGDVPRDIDGRRHDRHPDEAPSAPVGQQLETDGGDHHEAEPRRRHGDDEEHGGEGDPAAPRRAVEREHRPEAECGRPDEADLHRPEEVLEPAAEQQHDDPGSQPEDRSRRAPDEHEDETRDDEVERDQQHEVGHVRAQAEHAEHQSVDDDRRTQPMLVERSQEAPDVERATLDHRPFVREERQALAQGEQDQRGDRSRRQEEPRRAGTVERARSAIDVGNLKTAADAGASRLR